MIIGHEASGMLATFIFSFHMPIFFLLSGYTSHVVTSDDDFKKTIRNLFKKVWMLGAVMCVFYAVENWVANPAPKFQMWAFIKFVIKMILGGNCAGWNKRYANYPGVGVMWFMFAFFWSKSLFSFLTAHFKRIYLMMLCIIIPAIGYLISKFIWLPQSFDIAMVTILFMYVGMSLKGFSGTTQDKFKYPLLFLVLIYWLICLVHSVGLNLAMREYPYGFISIIEAIAGSVVIIFASKIIARVPLVNNISFFGRHTLSIMCIHYLDGYEFFWRFWVHNAIVAAIIRLFVDLSVLAIGCLVLKAYRKWQIKCQHI